MPVVIRHTGTVKVKRDLARNTVAGHQRPHCKAPADRSNRVGEDHLQSPWKGPATVVLAEKIDNGDCTCLPTVQVGGDFNM